MTTTTAATLTHSAAAHIQGGNSTPITSQAPLTTTATSNAPVEVHNAAPQDEPMTNNAPLPTWNWFRCRAELRLSNTADCMNRCLFELKTVFHGITRRILKHRELTLQVQVRHLTNNLLYFDRMAKFPPTKNINKYTQAANGPKENTQRLIFLEFRLALKAPLDSMTST
ncbi:hypothetical protein ACA910_006371 [Epithemia clementina (nom. ined.)]